MRERVLPNVPNCRGPAVIVNAFGFKAYAVMRELFVHFLRSFGGVGGPPAPLWFRVGGVRARGSLLRAGGPLIS